MAAPTSKFAELSEADRLELEAWLIEFDRTWTTDSLGVRLRSLPATPWRAAALHEIVKIDMERRGSLGRPVRLEQYLRACPELGTGGTAPAELIAHEYLTRRALGEAVALHEYLERFPAQAAELEQILANAPRHSVIRARHSPVDATALAFPAPTPSLPQSQDLAPQLPERFGRYRIVRRIGGGGMGTVYLAHDTQLDRQVALKVPRFSTADGLEIIQRFYREARAAATLQHRNICPVYDAAQIDGVHYLTMAYIAGQPLSDFTNKSKTSLLPQRQVALVVRKLALALHEAHRRGVVHRDLKPSNVVLDTHGEPIIMDFGLARRTEHSDAPLTHSGSILGTPAYMAPEQVRGDVKNMGPPCDIYGLGGILYELLTGRPPFSGELTTVLYKVVHEPPESPARQRADLDPRLALICLRALAKRAADRFGNMAEFVAALEAYLRNQPLPPATVPPEPGDRTLRAATTMPVLAPQDPLSFLGASASLHSPSAAAQPSQATTARRPAALPSGGNWLRTNRRWHVAAGGVGGSLLLATIFYVAMNRGTIKINPAIEVAPEANPSEVAASATIQSEAPARASRLAQLRLVATAGLPADPDDAKVVGVREELLAFVRENAGSAEAIEAIRLMSRVAWPVDALKREDIDPAQLQIAGRGDSRQAPEELVAVFGEGRLVAWQAATAISFSPRGDLIATGGGNAAITLWETGTGRVSRTITVDGVVQNLAWGPDGGTVAAALEGEYNPGIWDVATGTAKQTLTGRVGSIKALAYSSDGRFLSATGQDKVQLWKADTFEEQQVVSAPQKTAWLSLAGESALVGYTIHDKSVTLWQLPDGQEVARTSRPNTVQIAVSRDGQALAVVNANGTIDVLNTRDGSKRWSASVTAGKRLTAMSFSADGRMLAVGIEPGIVKIYAANTGEELGSRRKHEMSVILGLAFTPDNKTLLISEWDYSIELLDTATWKPRHEFGGKHCRALAAALSLDGQLLASGGVDRGIDLWNLRTAKHAKTLPSSVEWLRSLAFNGTGDLLAAQNAAYNLNVYDTATGTTKLAPMIARGVELAGRGPAVSFAARRNLLAAAQSDFSIKLTDLDTETELHALRGHKDLVWGLAFSPDGKFMASASADHSVRLWDMATGQPQEAVMGHLDEVRAIAYSPDGQTLASGGDNDQKVKLWDAATGRLRKTIRGENKSLRSLRFSDDGEWLVASGDGPVCFWNARTGEPARPPLTLGPPRGGVVYAAFTPDGRHLVTAHNNGTLYVLRLQPLSRAGTPLFAARAGEKSLAQHD